MGHWGVIEGLCAVLGGTGRVLGALATSRWVLVAQGSTGRVLGGLQAVLGGTGKELVRSGHHLGMLGGYWDALDAYTGDSGEHWEEL